MKRSAHKAYGQLGTTPRFRSLGQWSGTGNCGPQGASGNAGSCTDAVIVRGAQIVPDTTGTDSNEYSICLRVADGPGPGDIIEAGVDDLVICPAN